MLYNYVTIHGAKNKESENEKNVLLICICWF